MKKIFTLFIFIFVISCSSFAAENWRALEEKAKSEYNDNNCKDAFLLYKKIILEHKATPSILSNAVTSLKRAQLENEFDSFFEAVAKKYGKDPLILTALAKSKMRVSDYGYIIAGKFVRGNRRGGGQRVSSLERDRIEALRLLFKVLKNNRAEYLNNTFNTLKDIIMWGRKNNQAWKLQYLSDVNKLPDYEKRNRYYYGFGAQGAPVGADFLSYTQKFRKFR